jgi:hypothetical protein
MDDALRKHRARIDTYGAPLWLAEQLTRRLHVAKLHDRVQLRMHEIDNRAVK